MSTGTALRPEPELCERRVQGETKISALPCYLAGLLGFTLPIMYYLPGITSASKLNISLADLFLLPLVLILWRRWIRSGALGYWLVALWLFNLISWQLSLLLVKPDLVTPGMKLVTCFLYALTGYGIGGDARTEAAFLKGLLASALPVAALSILAYFTGSPSFFIVDSRVTGTFRDPNAFACYLAMLVPLVSASPAGVYALPLLLAGGLVTLSRTGLAALASSSFLSVLLTNLRRRVFLLVITLLALVALCAGVGQTTLSRRIMSYEDSLAYRQHLWGSALEVASKHPVFGIGKGNWETVSGERQVPHSSFLQVLVDGGVVGFGVFFFPLLIWLGKGLKRPGTRPWAIAVFAALVGGLAISLDNFRFFWLAVGLLVAGLARSNIQRMEDRSP